MINWSHLKQVHNILPFKARGTLYRFGPMGELIETRKLSDVGFKMPKRQNSQSNEYGPSTIKSAEIRLRVSDLGEFVPIEADVIHVVDPQRKIDSWWRLETLDNTLATARYVCTAVPTTPITAV